MQLKRVSVFLDSKEKKPRFSLKVLSVHTNLFIRTWTHTRSSLSLQVLSLQANLFMNLHGRLPDQACHCRCSLCTQIYSWTYTDTYQIKLVIKGVICAYQSIHELTWLSHDVRIQREIHHVIINSKGWCSLQNTCVMRGANFGIDHKLLLSKIRMTKIGDSKSPRFDVATLQNQILMEELIIAVR